MLQNTTKIQELPKIEFFGENGAQWKNCDVSHFFFVLQKFNFLVQSDDFVVQNRDNAAKKSNFSSQNWNPKKKIEFAICPWEAKVECFRHHGAAEQTWMHIDSNIIIYNKNPTPFQVLSVGGHEQPGLVVPTLSSRCSGVNLVLGGSQSLTSGCTQLL